MSAIDQKEYLKRYLSGGDGEETRMKKRRKKPTGNISAKVLKPARSVLLDDDVDFRSLWNAASEDKSALLEEADEAPLVAAYVDERPEEEVKLEEYRTSDRWKTLGDDENQPSTTGRHDDISPALRKPRHDSSPDASPPRQRQRHDSDSDLSPPRGRQKNAQKKQRHDSDSDFSPVRKNDGGEKSAVSSRSGGHHESDSDLSPQRTRNNHSKGRHDSDSDMSPQRMKKADQNNPKRKPKSGKRHESGSDLSPQREKNPGMRYRDDDRRNRSRRYDSDSDLSPPRPIKSKQIGRDSKSRTLRHDSDSDLSPVRTRKPSPASKRSKSDGKRRARHDSDSDLHVSPARRDKSGSRDKTSVRRDDGDLSPPRGRSKKDASSVSRQRQNSDSDLSPPRKQERPGGGERGRRKRMDSDSDLSPDRGGGSSKKKPTKTLSGAKAGLSDAAALRKENEASRRRNDEAYSKLTDDVSGRNAETVFRDKSGKKRDLKVERRMKREQEERQAEEDEKFLQWGKGVAQVKKQQDQIEDMMKEMEKPLARYKDDQDLDQMLKEKDREGDPMLAFLQKKQSTARAKAGIKEKPKYKGPKAPPNRFNLQPGYRWDGVDRSSGFEKKYFQRMSDKKAMSEVAYKWSVEDM